MYGYIRNYKYRGNVQYGTSVHSCFLMWLPKYCLQRSSFISWRSHLPCFTVGVPGVWPEYIGVWPEYIGVGPEFLECDQSILSPKKVFVLFVFRHTSLCFCLAVEIWMRYRNEDDCRQCSIYSLINCGSCCFQEPCNSFQATADFSLSFCTCNPRACWEITRGAPVLWQLVGGLWIFHLLLIPNQWQRLI